MRAKSGPLPPRPPPPHAATFAAERLPRDQWEHRHVGRLQDLPLFFVTLLREGAAHAVACAAGGLQVGIERRFGVVGAAFGVVEGLLRFGARQTVIVREVRDDVLRVVDGEVGHPVKAAHALQRLLPTFGTLAHVGDARHEAVAVRLVTGLALLDHEGIRNGMPRFDFRASSVGRDSDGPEVGREPASWRPAQGVAPSPRARRPRRGPSSSCAANEKAVTAAVITQRMAFARIRITSPRAFAAGPGIVHPKTPGTAVGGADRPPDSETSQLEFTLSTRSGC
jgi:hypothetical protein